MIYEVCWIVQVEAATPEEAAFKARIVQQDPHNMATQYEVMPYCPSEDDYHDDQVVVIDLVTNGTKQ